MLGAADIGRADPDEIDQFGDRDEAARGPQRRRAFSRSWRGPARTAQFLTPGEFADQFGASVDEYGRCLVSWVESRGLTVLRQEPSRASLTVSGSIGTIEDGVSHAHRSVSRQARPVPRALDRALSSIASPVMVHRGRLRRRRRLVLTRQAASSQLACTPARPVRRPPDLAKMYGFDQVSRCTAKARPSPFSAPGRRPS